MNQKIMQWGLAFLMGMLVPTVLFRFGEGNVDNPTVSLPVNTVPAIQNTSQPADIPVWIPVLKEGNIVVTMDLETYIEGVVLAEMPGYFEQEALMAQAVVARTYAMKRVLSADRHIAGAVCTNPGCCQAYISPKDYLDNKGSESCVNNVCAAVSATRGQILCYRGALAEATYFSCSGGRTEDALAVWGSEIPYLVAVDSPGEENAEKFMQTYRYTPEEFSQRMGRELTGNPDAWFGSETRTDGGGIAWLYVGGMRYSGVELRNALSLGSTNFEITVNKGQIEITCYGHGHRVGMSQYGAEAMAVGGSTTAQILGHYYPGTNIDKLENIM